jgi:hypothetical protein
MGTDGETIDWYVVRDRYRNNTPIGVLGFLDDEVVIIHAFHDDRDLNKDGKVSVAEFAFRFVNFTHAKGKAVADVATAAMWDENVYLRDASFQSMAMKEFLKVTRTAVLNGAMTAWLGLSMKMAAGAVAAQVGSGMVGSFVIKKGMETAVKTALKKSVGID